MSDFSLLREECLRAYLYVFENKPAKCGMAARVRVPSPSRPTVRDKATQPPNRFCLADPSITMLYMENPQVLP